MSYDEHQAMWPKMIAALAAIDAALGIPDDGCNSTTQTLEKIRRLRAAEDKCNSYIVDNARLAEQVESLRAALVLAEAALSDIGDADREPGDDLAWCEARAAQDLPTVRAALAALGPNVANNRIPTAPQD